jgi:hypothetical protein
VIVAWNTSIARSYERVALEAIASDPAHESNIRNVLGVERRSFQTAGTVVIAGLTIVVIAIVGFVAARMAARDKAAAGTAEMAQPPER